MAAPGDVLEDVLTEGLKLVFCGTQPGIQSALRKAYYAGRGNRFWPTLHEIGLTPNRFKPEDYATLLPLGIGLTDIAKLTAGQDADLSREHADSQRFWRSMRFFSPRIIAFTSKKAASLALGVPNTGAIAYGRQALNFEGSEVHVLPSTSGLATSHWTIEPWQDLASRIRELHDHATA